MSNIDVSKTTGVLSDVDIKTRIENKELVIHPYDERNLTPLGYNLSYTKFIYSVNNKILSEIFVEENKLFCYVEPNDTVLIMSHEAVWLSKALLGTFHSKVGIVSKGFGHISTTLDPDWEGPLLFSLNNPTNQRLRMEIGDEKAGRIEYKTFVTLILYEMITCSKIEQNNQPARIDILKSIKDSLGTSKYDKELLHILNNFQSLEIIRIGLSSCDNHDSKINEFKKKYNDFNVQIGDCIKQIDKIRNEKSTKKKLIKILIICLIVIVFIVILGVALNSYLTSNYSILSLIAIINSIAIFISREVYTKITKG